MAKFKAQNIFLRFADGSEVNATVPEFVDTSKELPNLVDITISHAYDLPVGCEWEGITKKP